jgi:hypothetical protein
MTTTATINNSSTATSHSETNTNEYKGLIRILKGNLLYTNGLILIKNITRVSCYPIDPAYLISTPLIIIALLVAFAGLVMAIQESPIFILLLLIFGGVAGYGIWERNKTKYFGITIELASGYFKYFISNNKEYIEQAYLQLTDAIINERDLLLNFSSKTIQNFSGVVNVAVNGSSINDNSQTTEITTQSGDVSLNSHNTTNDNSISVGSGNVTGNIGHTTNTGNTTTTGNTSVSGGSMTGDISSKE